VVPFGQIARWDTQGKDHGVVWEDARDIFRVVASFAEGSTPPKPESLRIEYWQSSWPHRRIPRDEASGAGSSGWLDVGDWFQGRWRAADTVVEASGTRFAWTFRPVNQSEFPDVGDFDVAYRSTFKLRIVGAAPLPPVTHFETWTDATWGRLDFEIEWGGNAGEEAQVWDGHVEGFNAWIVSVAPVSPESAVRVQADRSWTSRVEGGTDGVRVAALHTKPKGENSFDETIFTLRSAAETFSFAASDLLEHRHIFLPDFGVLVRLVPSPSDPAASASDDDAEAPPAKDAAAKEATAKDTAAKDAAAKDATAPESTTAPKDTTASKPTTNPKSPKSPKSPKPVKPMTYAEAESAWRERKAKDSTMDLYSRVAQAPEQTLTQAWNDVPAKAQHYIPLSFEGGRQHFGLEETGNVFLDRNWIQSLRGKDTPRCQWAGNRLRFEFGLPATPPIHRGIADGYLPIAVSVWERDGVVYRQTGFVVPFLGVPAPGARIWADDTLVLLLRFEMERRDGGKKPDTAPEARLDLAVVDEEGPQPASLEGDTAVTTHADSRSVRMLLRSADLPGSYQLVDKSNRVSYRSALSADAPRRVLEALIPYASLSSQLEVTKLRSIDFGVSLEAVRDYWRTRVEAGARIRTPEPMVNDFYRAHVSHLLINTEREVGVSDRYMAKVGTFHYGVYSNESCMMVSDLDRRGYHERAAQALEAWIHYQGTVGLPGDFSSKEGQFYGAGGYEHGGYNQHHGWVLWCLGEHWLYTRDRVWIARVAPAIVKACEWIVRERTRTIEDADRNPIRAIERGLLPPGRLEDIGDWRSWLSTNVMTWWGMRNAAAALADAGMADGARLLEESEAYRHDLLEAFGEAMRRSPVVRLRDSSWIPHVPADGHRRGRSFGWITETLEGAIHLVRCGAIEPDDRLSTWILRDYEDNLYLSKEFGYDLEGSDYDRYWFSRGGISMQANLLASPMPYLFRDEPKHFLRAYFNAFAVSYFPDTRMMTEHALPSFGDWRGDHYKSSDEANSTYWLRLMFIEERGDELRLGAALPRYWLSEGQTVAILGAATYFGPMSYRIESAAARGQIRMNLNPPRRNPPRVIRVRFRHPEGKAPTRCEVDGHPHDDFDPEGEWVTLTRFAAPLKLTVFYD
jgi:hypothetical protein